MVVGWGVGDVPPQHYLCMCIYMYIYIDILYHHMYILYVYKNMCC